MKRNCISLLLLISCSYLQAQSVYLPPVRSASEPDKGNRFFTGGNFGLQFGSTTAIDISPILGYRVTEKFSVGIGATYLYYHFKDTYIDYTNDIYGGNIFARYNVLENVFLHTEFESLSIQVYSRYPEYTRRMVDALRVGGGYRQMIGDYSSLNLMLLYDVMHDNVYSPYADPLSIRIGFDIGF